MSEFDDTAQARDSDAITATARLPGLEIEIVRRRAPGGDAEQISINLQAVPSFEAFGRFAERMKSLRLLGAGHADGLAAVARGRPGGCPAMVVPAATNPGRQAFPRRRQRTQLTALARGLDPRSIREQCREHCLSQFPRKR